MDAVRTRCRSFRRAPDGTRPWSGPRASTRASCTASRAPCCATTTTPRTRPRRCSCASSGCGAGWKASRTRRRGSRASLSASRSTAGPGPGPVARRCRRRATAQRRGRGGRRRRRSRQMRALVAKNVAALPGDLRHAVTALDDRRPHLAGDRGASRHPRGHRPHAPHARAPDPAALPSRRRWGSSWRLTGGFLLRKRKTERECARPFRPRRSGSKGRVRRRFLRRVKRRPARVPGPLARPRNGASPLLARPGPSPPSKKIFSPVPPSKRIFFPSPVPLSDQEQMLLAYVASTDPPETAARSGFLDEPAPLPPLPSDSPVFASLNELNAKEIS